MRSLLVISLVAAATAFVPVQVQRPIKTELTVHRRDVLVTALAGLVGVPSLTHASGSTFFYDEKIENVREPSQMHTGDKLDLNSAFVVSWRL